jgi:hypothetical protein
MCCRLNRTWPAQARHFRVVPSRDIRALGHCTSPLFRKIRAFEFFGFFELDVKAETAAF